MFMLDSSADTKSKFDDPNYLPDGEELFREKFSENLQMVEDIITSFSDDDHVLKSQESSGFQKFLFTSLEALDIDVTDYIGKDKQTLKYFLTHNIISGGLEIESIKHLGRLARGEDSLSPYYGMIADALIGLGSVLYGTMFN